MAIQNTPARGYRYPEVTDTPKIATRDLKNLALDVDSDVSAIEALVNRTAEEAADALNLAQEVSDRLSRYQDPIHVGPSEPTEGEELWVDTDDDSSGGTGGGAVSSQDITDATDVGRAILTAPWSANARNALSIFTGTRALLDAGTDTAERTWDAKELHAYVTETAAAAGGAASRDDLTGKPATYPPATHTHPITDVDGLQAALDALADANRTTDWRTLPLSNGWTGTVLINRLGVLVEILIDGLQRGGSSVAFMIPDGFRPFSSGATSPRPLLGDTSNPPKIDRTHISASGSFSVLSGAIGTGRAYGSVTYTTTDPWPTTLPPLA